MLWNVWRNNSMLEIQLQLDSNQVKPEVHELDDDQYRLLLAAQSDYKVMDNLALDWLRERGVVKDALKVLLSRMERELRVRSRPRFSLFRIVRSRLGMNWIIRSVC